MEAVDEPEALHTELRLDDPWGPPQSMTDVIAIGDDRIGRAAWWVRDGRGRMATGSAARLGDPPVTRAYYELIERTSTMDAMAAPDVLWPVRTGDGRHMGHVSQRELFPESEEPGRWRYARSNGVALHRSWEQARRRALWELVERDRILRSWYGLITPQRMDLSPELPGSKLYCWESYVIPDPDPTSWASDVRVAVVIGHPRRAGAPLVTGFGARDRFDDALQAAADEAVQRLAFLWEEDVPDRRPGGAPTPELHLDWYLYPEHHRHLRSWLEGGHGRYVPAWGRETGPSAEPGFVDLTPAELRERASVVRAVCPDALPLTFGPGPDRLAGHLPEVLRIHPIA